MFFEQSRQEDRLMVLLERVYSGRRFAKPPPGFARRLVAKVGLVVDHYLAHGMVNNCLFFLPPEADARGL